MSAHTFCNALYSQARRDCVKKHIHIGKLATYRFKASVNVTQYEIWQDSENKGWITACCASEAKFKFLCGLETKLREQQEGQQ